MKRKAICLLLAALMTLGAAGPVYAAGAPEETAAPVETEIPVETEAPAETEQPMETETPAETEEPVGTEQPAEMEAPAETEVPVETETPAAAEAPAMTDAPEPAAARDIPLWVEDPDWSIQSWTVGGKKYATVLYDNQTVPSGAVVTLAVWPGHDVTVEGGTLRYITKIPDSSGCLAAQIQVDADATHLYVHVYEEDRDVMRPVIRYENAVILRENDEEEHLILFTNKIRNLPEGGRFPLYVKQGARVKVAEGSVQYMGPSDAQTGYSLYLATVDPDEAAVTVTADTEGNAILRVDDASGKAEVRLGADTPGTGQKLADGYTFTDRVFVEVRRPAGYLTVTTAECETYDHAAVVPGQRTEMYDRMYLSDADWDGEVTVTVMPTVKVSLEMPEGYPKEEADPVVQYSVDGDTWEDAFEREVPANSRVRIAVHKDYVLTAEDEDAAEDESAVLDWYEGRYHWYEMTAPAGGSIERKIGENSDSPFTDVSSKDWYYKSVVEAYEAGIVTGMTEDTFEPAGTASRAQTVTMLHRIAGTPEPAGSAPFGDLTQEYYKKAVSWAAGEGVVTGMSSTSFEPDSSVTREQLAVMLYRMTGSPAVAGDRLGEYSDGEDVDSYARKGMAWALERGIMEGDTGGTLRPTGSATRAEVCTMLMRYKDAGLTWQPKPENSWVKDLKAAVETDQLLIVAAEGTTCSVTAYEKSGGVWSQALDTEGYVGAGGVGKTSEGDDKTPAGKYKFIKAFGVLDDPGCAIPYTKVDDSHYWVDDSSSKYYNQFVSTDEVEPDWTSAEHLAEVGAPYNYVLALDYNSARIPGEGSAIFLHCSSDEPTLGCVAIPEEDMLKVMRWVKSSCIVIIDSPEGVKNY